MEYRVDVRGEMSNISNQEMKLEALDFNIEYMGKSASLTDADSVFKHLVYVLTNPFGIAS